ncbi:hypothetical protein D9611_005046 [Ephemerocybe angulata]|uniref:Uncharacterized protein n=1 Tax=Ephemerocybe angulata TaxID=980116 RepID=A0A8H5B4D7_9AGAR|nr:hypothetical protein D9611_005046 [Tulosesus angulatus]
MYNNLDSPPPRSQFLPSSYGRQYTRPWSPDPYDPIPSTPGAGGSSNGNRDTFNRLQRDQPPHRRGGYDGGRLDDFVEEYPHPHLPSDEFPVLHAKPKREASEVSVEALDLADYARTLRTRKAEDPYPAFPFADSSLNSSKKEVHQRAYQPRNPDHPPSSYPAIVTRGLTQSSMNTLTTSIHETPRSNVTVPLPANGRTNGRSSRRPYSLPNSPHGSTPQLGCRQPQPEDEIDISQFPAWSRNWYNSNDSRHPQGPPRNGADSLEAYELEAGLSLPQPLLNDSSSRRGAPSYRSGNPNPSLGAVNPKPLSPFDPAYIHPHSYPRNGGDDYPSYAAPSYTNHDPLLGDGREGVVPWSYDPPEYNQPPMDPQVKEKRMRMLEKAFGTPTDSKVRAAGQKAKEKEKDDCLMRDDNGKLIVGTPDGKGGLVTQAPHIRTSVRVLQILLAVAVGAPVIYAAIVLKPKSPPPPAGKIPFYILCVLAPLTLVLLLYLFVVRPCTLRRRFSSAASFTHPAAQGMMVLPVAGAWGGKQKGGKKGAKKGPMMFPGPGGKKNKKGKKGGGMPMGDVQVNLIVDPNAFGMPGDNDLSSSSEEEDEMFDDGGMPGAFFAKGDGADTPKDKERARRKRKRQKRRSLVASLKLEEDWKFARGWMRKLAFINAGKRCPTGGKEKGYGGWCTAYNASTACSFLLCLSFAISIFFGVKDLYASKLSPRTRM